MSDTYTIDDLEALRAVIGPSFPGVELKNMDHIYAEAREYIERSPFVIMATSDAEGRLDASPKGDEPGFCWVQDDRTLVIPDRPGNRLVYGLQNLLSNPRVGLIFMLPGTPETVRINGTAALTTDPELLARLSARGRPAVLAIRVHVEECFHHCAKAFIRSRLWQPETWAGRLKISFGKMVARRMDLGDEVAEKIETAVEQDYRDNL